MGKSHGLEGNGVRRAHLQGLALLVFAVALSIGVTVGLGMWGANPKVLALSLANPAGLRLQDRGDVVGAPRPSSGLIPSNENRGQVLFGRYCDSCHPGGSEGKGENLLSAEFQRDYRTEKDITELVRAGTCKMPAYSRFFLPDGDVADIAKFTLARAKTAGTTASPLPPLDGRGIMEQKCIGCHEAIDMHIDARDVQMLYALDDMAKCAGLTGDQKEVLRAFVRATQGR